MFQVYHKFDLLYDCEYHEYDSAHDFSSDSEDSLHIQEKATLSPGIEDTQDGDSDWNEFKDGDFGM